VFSIRYFPMVLSKHLQNPLLIKNEPIRISSKNPGTVALQQQGTFA